MQRGIDRGGRPELDRARAEYLDLAKSIANQTIRRQLGPLLEEQLGQRIPRGWNPLRVAYSTQSFNDLSMKLANPQSDPFARAILRGNLVPVIEEIIVDALEEALTRDTELHKTPFIAAILRDLMKEQPKVAADSSEWPVLDPTWR